MMHDKPFWSKKWGKDKICPITQSRLRPGKNKYGIPYIIELGCGHKFYRMALLKWSSIQQVPKCPVCRKEILNWKN